MEEDIENLIKLVEHLGLSTAHIAGNSFGAAIVLKTATRRPGLFKSLVAHEPPLFDLLKDHPQAQEALKTVNGRIKTVLDLIAEKRIEKATEEFMEKIAMGEGA